MYNAIYNKFIFHREYFKIHQREWHCAIVPLLPKPAYITILFHIFFPEYNLDVDWQTWPSLCTPRTFILQTNVLASEYYKSISSGTYLYIMYGAINRWKSNPMDASHISRIRFKYAYTKIHSLFSFSLRCERPHHDVVILKYIPNNL